MTAFLALLAISSAVYAGDSAVLKGSVTPVRKGMKLEEHAAKLRFKSSDSSVAEVSESGKVKAKKTGSCRIYVQTVNGIWKTCSISVK